MNLPNTPSLPGDATPLAWHVPASGTLTVQAGRLWLTREGHADDHVLAAGAQIDLREGERVWLSAWDRGGPLPRWRFCAGSDARTAVPPACERCVVGPPSTTRRWPAPGLSLR